MDFDKTKKLMVDRWFISGGLPFFRMGFTCGREDIAYLLDAQAAKGFYLMLGDHIQQVEKQLGKEIDMTGYEMGTLAPFQPG